MQKVSYLRCISPIPGPEIYSSLTCSLSDTVIGGLLHVRNYNLYHNENGLDVHWEEQKEDEIKQSKVWHCFSMHAGSHVFQIIHESVDQRTAYKKEMYVKDITQNQI